MNIYSYPDRDVLIKKTQETLESLFQGNSNKPVLFLSSGGSSLALLNDFNFTLGSNITITMLDERGYNDPLINNFSQLARTSFFHIAAESGCSFIETVMNDEETPEELANRYNAEVETWIQNHPEGIIIATIGLGQDGHIAGIMPHPEEEKYFKETFVETDRAVVSYNASGKNEFANRITVTIPVLKKISYPIVFFYGESKLQPWSMVTDTEGSLAKTPARIVRELKNVQIFTDLLIQGTSPE